jgi:hypothetical protein
MRIGLNCVYVMSKPHDHETQLRAAAWQSAQDYGAFIQQWSRREQTLARNHRILAEAKKRQLERHKARDQRQEAAEREMSEMELDTPHLLPVMNRGQVELYNSQQEEIPDFPGDDVKEEEDVQQEDVKEEEEEGDEVINPRKHPPEFDATNPLRDKYTFDKHFASFLPALREQYDSSILFTLWFAYDILKLTIYAKSVEWLMFDAKQLNEIFGWSDQKGIRHNWFDKFSKKLIPSSSETYEEASEGETVEEHTAIIKKRVAKEKGKRVKRYFKGHDDVPQSLQYTNQLFLAPHQGRGARVYLMHVTLLHDWLQSRWNAILATLPGGEQTNEELQEYVLRVLKFKLVDPETGLPAQQANRIQAGAVVFACFCLFELGIPPDAQTGEGFFDIFENTPNLDDLVSLFGATRKKRSLAREDEQEEEEEEELSELEKHMQQLHSRTTAFQSQRGRNWNRGDYVSLKTLCQNVIADIDSRFPSEQEVVNLPGVRRKPK